LSLVVIDFTTRCHGCTARTRRRTKRWLHMRTQQENFISYVYVVWFVRVILQVWDQAGCARCGFIIQYINDYA
jgi:hypothetical protein